jgi:hypothetical protein
MAAAKAGVDVETRDGGSGSGSGGGGSFSEERLVDKLNKLNNTAASIQSILCFSPVVTSRCSWLFLPVPVNLVYPVKP